MRVLILWAEPGSANLGVRVLGEGAAALARQAFGEVEVEHQGYGPGGSPVPLGSSKRMLARLARPDAVSAWLSGFDLVLDTRAGDSFADIYGRPRHRRMGLMHEAAHRAGVPVVLTPQTVGPFQTREGRLLARRTLTTAALTMARDGESLRVARALGSRSAVLTTDVCFALSQPEPAAARHDVLLNVSGLLWQPNPHVEHQLYRQVVTGLVERLRSDGREVTLLAHVLDSPVPDNDGPTVRALATELGLAAIVPADLAEARTVIAGAEVLLGSRMHACLNALSVGTPAVPLAYSRKFAPLFDRLGWPGTVDLRTEPEVVSRAVALVEDPGTTSRLEEVVGRARADIARAVQALSGLG